MPHKLIPLAILAILGGLAMWLQILLSMAIRFVLRSDSAALSELLALPSFGWLYACKPFAMRVKLFFPWVSVHSVKRYPASVGLLVWAARLSGTALFVCFLGVISYVAYLVVTGA